MQEPDDYDGAWKATVDAQEQDWIASVRLIYWLLALPQREELAFCEGLVQLQRETNMPYISTYDRLVGEKSWKLGREQGRLELLRELIREPLTRRFGGVPEDLLSQLDGIHSEAELKRLIPLASSAESLTAFVRQTGEAS